MSRESIILYKFLDLLRETAHFDATNTSINDFKIVDYGNKYGVVLSYGTVRAGPELDGTRRLAGMYWEEFVYDGVVFQRYSDDRTSLDNLADVIEYVRNASDMYHRLDATITKSVLGSISKPVPIETTGGEFVLRTFTLTVTHHYTPDLE